MRHAFWLLPLGLAVVAVATCVPPAAVRTQPVDNFYCPVCRLNYPSMPPAAVQAPPADNFYCLVCHMNYKPEKLAVRHAWAGVGCMKCHGDSQDHSGDEDNVTPPDIMYPRETIDKACMECHPGNELAQKEIHQEGMQAGKVCTDCHGSHRLAHRTRRWDKATGDLIELNGAPVPIVGGTGRGVKPQKGAAICERSPSLPF